MKSLKNYILESIKPLSSNKKGIVVFDIDDTLLKSDPNTIKIYKTVPGEKEIALSTDEYAKDPDALDMNKRSWFSYRDFRDEEKVYKSIIEGTPLIKNLKIMDAYLNAGYDFSFLTARSCEDVIKNALSEFLKKISKEMGLFQQIDTQFKKTLSHAINDFGKKYKGYTDSEKKANVLREMCKKYDYVVFVDDDMKNIRSARELNLKNLKVVKAWED
jgi:acid phosphatase class B